DCSFQNCPIFDQHDMWRRVGENKRRTKESIFIAMGTQDDTVPFSIAKEALKLMPTAILQPFEMGHDLILYPEVIRSIVDFMLGLVDVQ
ncbi:hypothetical protein PROFUN_15285, partial [Planoprotostelium fungivorum]